MSQFSRKKKRIYSKDAKNHSSYSFKKKQRTKLGIQQSEMINSNFQLNGSSITQKYCKLQRPNFTKRKSAKDGFTITPSIDRRDPLYVEATLVHSNPYMTDELEAIFSCSDDDLSFLDSLQDLDMPFDSDLPIVHCADRSTDSGSKNNPNKGDTSSSGNGNHNMEMDDYDIKGGDGFVGGTAQPPGDDSSNSSDDDDDVSKGEEGSEEEEEEEEEEDNNEEEEEENEAEDMDTDCNSTSNLDNRFANSLHALLFGGRNGNSNRPIIFDREIFHSGSVGRFSSMGAKYKSILKQLQNPEDPNTQIVALQELAESLCVATEDVLSLNSVFPLSSYIDELSHLLKYGHGCAKSSPSEENDEFMSFGFENPEVMLLACRCISYILEAYPSSVMTIVHNKIIIRALCEKLLEVSFIDLAEQALSTLEKISREYPESIVKEGGLLAVLQYIDFFSSNIQRKAILTASNCCEDIPNDCIEKVKEAIPILENLIIYSDEKVSDLASLALLRIAHSFKKNPADIEILITTTLLQTVGKIVFSFRSLSSLPSEEDILHSSINSTKSGDSRKNQLYLLRFLIIVAKGSPKLANFILTEMNFIEGIYYAFTGFKLVMDSIKFNREDCVNVSDLISKNRGIYLELLTLVDDVLPEIPKAEFVKHPRKTNPFSISAEGHFPSNDSKINLEDQELLNSSQKNENPLGGNSGGLLGMASFDSEMTEANINSCIPSLLVEHLAPLLVVIYWSCSNVIAQKRVVSCLLKTSYHFLQLDIESFDASELLSNLASIIGDVLMKKEQQPLIFLGLILLDGVLKKKAAFAIPVKREGVSDQLLKLLEDSSILLTEGKNNELIAIAGYLPKDIVSYVQSLHDSIERNIPHFQFSALDLLSKISKGLFGTATDPLGVTALYQLAKILVTPISNTEGITSYELFHSNIIDSLLDYLTKNTPEYQGDIYLRLKAFLHVFMGATVSPDIFLPLKVKIDENHFAISGSLKFLIEKLQVALSRNENFQICKVTNKPDTTPHRTLMSHIRIKLISEGDSPGETFDLSVNAATSFNSLLLYLKPRLFGLDAIVNGSFGKKDSFIDKVFGRNKGDNKLFSSNDSQEKVDNGKKEVKVGSTSTGSSSRALTYAMAAKKSIDDFSLSFKYEGQDCDINETVFGAIYKFYRNGEFKDSDQIAQFAFNGFHTIKYFTIPKPSVAELSKSPKDKDELETLNSNFEVTSCSHRCQDKPFSKSELHLYNTFSALGSRELSHCQSKELRSLINVLHVLNLINECWEEIFKPTEKVCDNVVPLPAAAFINSSLSAKLEKQLQESILVVSKALPSWVEELPKLVPFLFPLRLRFSFFKSVSFNTSRYVASISKKPSYHSGNSSQSSSLTNIHVARQKVRVYRTNVLNTAVKVMENYASKNSILEVEYFDEVGAGLGPTLEFYSLVSREFSKVTTEMWRKSSYPGECEDIVNDPLGLFPVPFKGSCDSDKENQICRYFKTLGKFVAKAILDNRIVDVRFNLLFLKLVFQHCTDINPRWIKYVDEGLYYSLQEMRVCVEKYNNIKEKKDHEELVKNIRLQGISIEDLCLDFTLPGYPNFELIDNGKDIPVTIHNLEDYINKIIDFTIGKGIQQQMEAFKMGFNDLLPVENMQVFSLLELSSLFGFADEDWSFETLVYSIKSDHGYNNESHAVRMLITIMSDFELSDRRKFLQFITGSPKLPIGGFKALNPPFTVVHKAVDSPHSPDSYLPSVMTCVNYLKLPDYSSKEIMRTRLLTAITEGQGSFHLS